MTKCSALTNKGRVVGELFKTNANTVLIRVNTPKLKVIKRHKKKHHVELEKE